MTTFSRAGSIPLASRLFAFTTLAAGLGLGVLSLGSQGCTVTTGNSDGGDFDSGAAPDTAVPSGNPACNSCLFQQCSGQYSVCQGSADCIAIYQCATKAGCDTNCVTACFNAYPAGKNAYTALYTCDQVGACEPGCQAACSTPAGRCTTTAVDSGAGVDSATPPGPLDCTSCVEQKCATENAQCGTNSDCDQYAQCTAVCTDTPCLDTCGEAHSVGKSASAALATCTSTTCQKECGL